jgi:hypothetical protein
MPVTTESGVGRASQNATPAQANPSGTRRRASAGLEASDTTRSFGLSKPSFDRFSHFVDRD